MVIFILHIKLCVIIENHNFALAVHMFKNTYDRFNVWGFFMVKGQRTNWQSCSQILNFLKKGPGVNKALVGSIHSRQVPEWWAVYLGIEEGGKG